MVLKGFFFPFPPHPTKCHMEDGLQLNTETSLDPERMENILLKKISLIKIKDADPMM